MQTKPGNDYHKLIAQAKLLSIPSGEASYCKLCTRVYEDIVFHITMDCAIFNDHRNRLWDDILNIIGVVNTVNLLEKEDDDILDILFGKKWEGLEEYNKNQLFNVITKYMEICTKGVKHNITWYH